MSHDPCPLTETDHGIAGWPGAAEPCGLPACLPDGSPWPRVGVLILSGGADADLAATRASVSGQGYPDLHCVLVAAGAAGAKTVAACLSDTGTDYLLWLSAGDLLAPGALAALCLEAELTGAGAVAGLRVLFDRGAHRLDILAGADAAPDADDGPCVGEVLVARHAAIRAELVEDGEVAPGADLMARLTAAGVAIARIGRPVLLRRDRGGARTSGRAGLSVVALTDLGYGGGAGIAHRRLAEALELSGHRVAHLRLGDESPPAAAEWTERFPRSEAAILSSGHDLVLVGNLHGVTRDGGLLDRLARRVPTGIVLHDLFALTGRCAHPKACAIIAEGCDARCPSPTAYPQLAPGRIAGAHARKRAALSGDGSPLLLANSAWTRERARALAPDGACLATIRLAFPTGVFRPRDRAALRRRLGLPPHDVLILFSAVIADAPDKGFADLVATMARIAKPGIGFVALGRLDDPRRFRLPGLNAPGPIGDEETLAQWYGASDIYLTASRLETLGQTPIEAGLCGIPTVAYRATGLTSAVLDGVTGLLAEPREGALAEALERLIADATLRRRLGAYARIVLENRFSHASAALSLHEALAGWDRKRFGLGPRLRFAPDMLGRFAYARDRHAGATGLVAPPSRPIVRALRRGKQAVFGGGMPLWMRRALYAAVRLRAGASRRSP